ncbi:Vacuolar protein sorting-associated protein 53-like [Oopsacas minuta]|uniref:Vacuolar protein sorting-associated protein 53-like n=1 Tax=Oopsacas minuta TaxID=111878 RepID=A0AAV7JGF7_9METZ|nr:Vacuolar protein sorting-associated protein 53-like [Oopsacas minuta]
MSISSKRESHINLLSDACRVVKLSDPSLREEIVAKFIELQLFEYQMLYKENQENSWLDKIDRRFSWMRREIVEMEKILPLVFPSEWNVLQTMCQEFCTVTKLDLLEQLRQRSSDIEVKLLLFAIQKTSDFERLLAQRFSTPESESKSDVSPFMGLISKCFESHLDVFIGAQDKNLGELLDEFIEEMKRKDSKNKGSTSTVFSSSGDLFVFYKKCLVQCITLSTGVPLLHLSNVFKKYLKEYANRILISQIPKLAVPSVGGIKLLLKESERDNLTKEESMLVCGILCTADYCLETAQQLEDKLKEKIQNDLQSQVKFADEYEVFNNIITTCIQLLVQDADNACSNAFHHMIKKSRLRCVSLLFRSRSIGQTYFRGPLSQASVVPVA